MALPSPYHVHCDRRRRWVPARRNIDWRLAATLVAGAIAGVYVGAKAMVRVPAPQLRLLFGAFLFFVASRQLVWQVSTGAPQAAATAVVIDLAVGFAGGILAGVLGVGRGAIFVPAIVIFGLAHVAAGEDPQKIAQGVSLVVIIATGAVGTITNLHQGTIDTQVTALILPSAMAAALAAPLVPNRLDANVLKYVYGLTALFLGCQVVYLTLRSIVTSPAATIRKV